MEKPNVKVIYHPGYGFQYVRPKTETFKEDHPCEHAPNKENNMETINQIHQKVSKMNLSPFELWEVKRLIEIAFRAGLTRNLEQPDPLEGYSNLTAAIKAGEPIDWEKLDGVKAKCVHPELGTLTRWLERDKNYTGDSFIGWCKLGSGQIWEIALDDAWHGERGWTLWVEGDIPLRRKTADQLPLGTCFEGEYHGSRIELAQVIANRYGNRLVTDHAVKNIGGYAEEEVEVIKEYGIGTFQKPEGK